MAYEIGVATNHVDLFEKLIAFLTTNEELVYDGQEWSVAWSLGTDLGEGVVVSGPGLGGSEEVLIGMRLEESLANEYAAINFVGMTGVIPSAVSFRDHVNVTPNGTRVMLRDGAMDYWFSATGRRFTAMVKVSTVYEACYAGFFLPYSLPSQYPYPLFVGASAHDTTDRDVIANWRSLSEGHANYLKSFAVSNPSTGHPANAWMLDPSGNWLNAGVSSLTPAMLGPRYFGGGFGVTQDAGSQSYGYRTIINRLIPAYGDEHALVPITLMQESPSDQTFGILDGVYHVAGRGNYPENTIVADGVTHVVGINVYRSNTWDYWAMALGVIP